MVTIKNTQRLIKIDREKISQDSQEILNIIGYPDFDLGIWFTTNKTIQRLNRDYRGKDKPTDILSFSFYPNLKPGQKIIVDDPDEKNLGDLVLSPAYIVEQIKNTEVNLTERLEVLLIHGICHLLGYDHEIDKDYRQMRAKEVSILKKLKASQNFN